MAPVFVERRTSTFSCNIRLPSRRSSTPTHVTTDFMMLREPVVVVQATDTLPGFPAASTSGFVKAITSPCRFARRHFVLVFRMWVEVAPLPGSFRVRVRAP
jgi:hypothetical protein